MPRKRPPIYRQRAPPAEHIIEGEEARGLPAEEAKRIAFATVNKQVNASDPKRRFSAKEHRQVEHIEASEEARGKSPEEAKSIAYATVNKHKAQGK